MLYIDTSENNNPRISIIENHDNLSELEYMIYPNPNDGNFTFYLKNNQKNISLNITDLLGKTILTFITKQENTKLNITSLAPGIYILLFNINEKQYKINFIKQ